MITVAAGNFVMGSNAHASESPPVPITISSEFALGKFEVTFEEWAACVDDSGCQSNPAPSDRGWGEGRRPVIYVTWDHANEYVSWLNSIVEGQPYRLPSEAEWEYAAREGVLAGENHRLYSWGSIIECSNANYDGGTGSNCATRVDGQYSGTRPVGSYPENQLGLHDMHGNVWEWVEDCWHYGYASVPDHVRLSGTAWIDKGDTCSFRVIRGGSWVNYADRLRITNRSRLGAVNRDFNYGFRVARSLP